MASWIWAGAVVRSLEREAIDKERAIASTNAATLMVNFRLSLAHMRSIPTLLTRDPDVLTLLARFGPDAKPSSLSPEANRRMWMADPEIAALARRLEGAVGDVGINQIWVMNAAGDCLVSGGFPVDASATGVNYVDRDYFQAARQGVGGHQFAVGRTTDVPGLYYSAPVVLSGRFVGAVVVKMELKTLEALVTDPDSFATDDNGVVILAGDRGLLMHSLPNALVGRTVPADLSVRYKRSRFDRLDLVPTSLIGESGLVLWQGRATPFVMASRGPVDDIVTVHVLRGLWAIADIERERRWLFLSLAVSGTSLMIVAAGVMVHLRGQVRHGRAMAQANAELAALNVKLSRQANEDPLTGCANRRQIMAVLAAERRRAERYAGVFSVVILDLDHFKDINDRHGHPAGDAALRHFAQRVGGLLRATDTLGRLGGDEFVVLMPETDVPAAEVLVDRIVEALAASPLRYAGQDIALQVSAGIAQWRGDLEDSVDDLLMRADTSLYAAKARRPKPGDGGNSASAS
jgi:diguanylate cyclase (GGDEF)-like protein